MLMGFLHCSNKGSNMKWYQLKKKRERSRDLVVYNKLNMLIKYRKINLRDWEYLQTLFDNMFNVRLVRVFSALRKT